MTSQRSFAGRVGGFAKVVAIGGALAGTLFAAAPAQAAEEAGLPSRTITTHHADGKVTAVKELDYAKARSAALKVKAAASCPDGWICLYEHENGGGNAIAFEGHPSGHNDFSRISCPSCHGGTFNDQMSSFVNKTGRTWWWYFDAHGHGERHNMNRADTPFNLARHEQDKASSIYSWG
ncbi:peptidase inhibitor family I36 protein [Allokutzneria albata]|uniref:Peptidase inhibitor family I36 n=1 Tax=Allokutzneria albata TaxID=211114 RepID=A0A1G9RY16_ALLAB|nr:peptidase inhibitor family I36 protein [Allokutzneria albata]SDM27910.1 hypothetical protein SAMN04489726_0755 [Allokutzneria albata]